MKRPLLYTLYIMCIAALLPFTSCSRGIHEQGNALAIEIVWDENSMSEGDDTDTPPDLTGITVYIYGTDGTLRDSIRYNNAGEVAANSHQVPAGDYVIVTTSNVEGSLSVNDEEIVSLEQLMIEQGEDAPPGQAYYSIQWVHVDATGVTTSRQELRPVLSRLQVNVVGATEGSTLQAEVLNAAKCFYPSRPNSAGSYGIPSEETTAYTLPAGPFVTDTRAETTGRMSTDSHLMPTATGETEAVVRITYTPQGGTPVTQTYRSKPMLSGKQYELTLNLDMEIVLDGYDYGTSDWDRVEF